MRSNTPDFSAGALPLAVIERVSDRFRLLGDPTRLRLVNALHVDGELSVGELVERVGMSYGAVSKQLAMLRSSGLLGEPAGAATAIERMRKSAVSLFI